MKKRHFTYLFFFLSSFLISVTVSFVSAQEKEKALPDVDVVHSRFFQMTQDGFYVESDTLQQRFFAFSSLSEWLQKAGFMNIRMYGPGMLSSVSSGGGNASQVQVLWNGIPLNHPMLGQTDVSMLSLQGIQHIRASQGLQSMTFGSGSISGYVNMQSLAENPDTISFIHSGATYSSLKNNTFFVKGRYKKCYAAGDMNYGKNQFEYVSDDKTNMATLPVTSLRGFVNFYHRFKCHFVAFEMMGSFQKRFLGDFVRNVFDKKRHQTDVLFMPSFHHVYSDKLIRWENQWYYQPYYLTYVDSVSRIFSNSVARRFGNIHNVRVRFGKFLWMTRGEIQLKRMYHPSYRTEKKMDFFSISQSLRYYVLSALFAEGGLRKDAYLQTQRFPFTWYAGLNASPWKFLSLWIKTGTAFRHPTGNELYWTPGGNPGLLPEVSRGTEAGMKVQGRYSFLNINFSGEIFHRYTDNWILWTPGAGGFPTPMNIRKVWSRGAMTHSDFCLMFRKIHVYLFSVTSYVLSTIEKEYSEQNTAILGRQLIYTPRYTFNHSLLFEVGVIRTGIRHHYEGYRFTTTDNTRWLMPFHLWDISLYATIGKKNRVTLGAELQNITNTRYSLISGYPMPGRIWMITASFLFLKSMSNPKIHQL